MIMPKIVTDKNLKEGEWYVKSILPEHTTFAFPIITSKLPIKKIRGLRYYLGKTGRKKTLKVYNPNNSIDYLGYDVGKSGGAAICKFIRLPDGRIEIKEIKCFTNGEENSAHDNKNI